MQKRSSLRGRLLVAAAAVTMMIGFTAVQGFAASTKTVGMDVSRSASSFLATDNTMSTGEARTMYFRLSNTTPGNSNPNSFGIEAPPGFSIGPNSAAYVSGTTTNTSRIVSNTSTTISVTGLDPLKSFSQSSQKPVVILSATVTASLNETCATTSHEWQATGWTGSIGNGSSFVLVAGHFTTTVTSSCGTVSAQVYKDTNGNGVMESSEASTSTTLGLGGFGFALRTSAGGSDLQTASSSASGLAQFSTPVSGSYYVCQTSVPTATPAWVNTDPGGSPPCQQVTVGVSGVTANFGDAQQASVTVTKYNDANVDQSLDNNEVTLSGWQFTMMDGNTEVASQSTGTNGTTTFTGLAPGKTYSVCETDVKIDPNSPGFKDAPWFNTDPGGSSPCKSFSTTSGSTANMSFGNALGNLDCLGSIESPDGKVTVERLNNLNDVQCTVKPASVDHTLTNSAEAVKFLVTGDSAQQAAYMITINWDPISNDNPPGAVATSIDLPSPAHPLEWCLSETGGTNGNPELPQGQVGCIVSQTWNIVDSTHVREREVIYLEADIILSKSK